MREQKEKKYATKEIDKVNFEKCCDYIRYNLLGHPQGTKCPTFIVHRVRGFCRGQFMANSNNKGLQEYEYDYETLYVTLVYCKSSILDYFNKNNKKINDSKDVDSYKVNLIFKIVEGKINVIHNKLKSKNKNDKKLETMNVEQLQHNDGAKYQKKNVIEVNLISMSDEIKDLLKSGD